MGKYYWMNPFKKYTMMDYWPKDENDTTDYDVYYTIKQIIINDIHYLCQRLKWLIYFICKIFA